MTECLPGPAGVQMPQPSAWDLFPSSVLLVDFDGPGRCAHALIFPGGGWLRLETMLVPPWLRPTSPARSETDRPCRLAEQTRRILIAHQQDIEMLLS